jgi:thiamine phosphate synthase YjbQ (UPF0047 family)
MNSYRKELWFNVPGRRAFINITPQVKRCLAESRIREGLCLVNAMHIYGEFDGGRAKRVLVKIIGE